MNTIEKRYGIARSTLSGWFRNVKLTPAQKKKLSQNSNAALISARKRAVLWHNAQKQRRLREAKLQALHTLRKINPKNRHILELTLAILYLGEGNKASVETSIGNSDPLILKFFLSCLRKIYNFNVDKIRCELHLRADQDPERIKRFWAKKLKLSLSNFKQVTIDKRTLGSKTFAYYKGVCVLRCANVAIQRKLLYLARYFCEQIIKSSGS
ncbi:MAG: hypothetical protein HYW70_03365 [Candidatus Nealsonbacteria bacterium]|nr:hypothetical protein [Candidatus Nealsonbacteria bacterium]